MIELAVKSGQVTRCPDRYAAPTASAAPFVPAVLQPVEQYKPPAALTADMADPTFLRRLLKEHREGLTGRQLAERYGVHPSYIYVLTRRAKQGKLVP